MSLKEKKTPATGKGFAACMKNPELSAYVFWEGRGLANFKIIDGEPDNFVY